MDAERFLAVVRALSRDADDVVARLDLPRGQTALNVHAYALGPYEEFVRRHVAPADPPVGAVAMNPGRNGAVQTGIPFADLDWARGLLPEFDALLGRPRVPLPAPSRELSGRRIVSWAERRFDRAVAMYDHVQFFITCPVAVLEGTPPRNVPIPALTGANRRLVDALVRENLARLVAASGVRSVLLLGRYAESVWETAEWGNRRPPSAEATFHPAAHVSNRKYFASMDAAYGRAATKALKRGPS